MRSGTLRAPSPITVAEASKDWLERAAAGVIRTRSGDHYKPAALRAYRHAVDCLMVGVRVRIENVPVAVVVSVEPSAGVRRRATSIVRMDRKEQRRERLANWAKMAAGWERAREHREKGAAPVTEWLVRAFAPREGETVLELAAGQGDVGYAVAPNVGTSGRVISTDFSPAMVEIADRRSAELGLTNVTHRVFDAEQIELEDDSVDGVLCRFGYMLMPDPATALRETRRVLRPGGRLALAVWSSGDRNPWMALAGRILVRRGQMPPPEPGEPGMFVLGDENQLRRLLEEADFARIRIEAVPVHFGYADVEDYIRRANETGGMFARAWSAASKAEQSAIKDELREAFAPFAVDGSYELPGLALCALAS